MIFLSEPIWIVRDYIACSGCRRCEIACSMHHEGWMWPEASRIRVFMPFPGLEVPHFCAQCEDSPCVSSCPVNALTINENTNAVIVDGEKCIGCGSCIKACPAKVPFLHPENDKAVICDLCEGEPECVKVCQEAGYNALILVKEDTSEYRKLFAMEPIVVAKDLAVNLLGEKGLEVI